MALTTRRANILLVLLLLVCDASTLKHRRPPRNDKGRKADKGGARPRDQNVLVLTMDSSTSATSNVVVDVFEESMREITKSPASHFELVETPVIVTEVNQRGYNLIILCIETVGDFSMVGLQEFSDAAQRQLKKRRGGSMPKSSRKGKKKNSEAVSVNNLLDLVNSKTSAVKVDGLYSTDLIPCGDPSLSPTAEPSTNSPSQAPTISGRPSSKNPTSGTRPKSGKNKVVSPTMLLQRPTKPPSPSKPVSGKGSQPSNSTPTPSANSPSMSPVAPVNDSPVSPPNAVPTAPTTSMPSSADSTPSSFPTSVSPPTTPQPSRLVTTMEPSQTWSPSLTPQPSNTPQPSQSVT